MLNKPIRFKLFNAALGLLRPLWLPFKVIYYGHLKLVIFLGAAAGVCFFLAERGSLTLSSYLLALHSKLHLNPTLTNKILPLSQGLCWLALLPVLLTTMALPTRLIWRHHRLSCLELCSLGPRQIIACGRALCITARTSFYLLIPAAAMGFLYIAFVKNIHQPLLYSTYSLACSLVCIATIYRALPVLMTPFITVCGGYTPQQALYFSQTILAERRKELFFGTAILLGIALLAVHLRQFHISWPESACLAAWAWYTVTFFALSTINAIAKYEATAAPKKQTRSTPLDVSHPLNEPPSLHAHSANTTQDNGPVSVRVTKVWVHD